MQSCARDLRSRRETWTTLALALATKESMKRPRSLFLDGTVLGTCEQAHDNAHAKASARPKRSRSKWLDEGDSIELKARHIRGKRKGENVMRREANCETTLRCKADEPADNGRAFIQIQLARVLRPKTRRWTMYEWFHSPADFVWLQNSAFFEMLQVCPFLDELSPCRNSARSDCICRVLVWGMSRIFRAWSGASSAA